MVGFFGQKKQMWLVHYNRFTIIFSCQNCSTVGVKAFIALVSLLLFVYSLLLMDVLIWN